MTASLLGKALIACVLFALPLAARAESAPAAPSTGAEIQIFFGYKSANDYDLKIVSTQANAFSAGYLLDKTRPAGACFKGEVAGVARLAKRMIRIYNIQNRRALSVITEPFYDHETHKGAVAMYLIDEMGREWPWFTRMRECGRWSTAAERAARPGDICD